MVTDDKPNKDAALIHAETMTVFLKPKNVMHRLMPNNENKKLSVLVPGCCGGWWEMASSRLWCVGAGVD